MRYFFSGIDPRYRAAFDDVPQAGWMFSASTLMRPSVFSLFASTLKTNRPMVLDSGVIQGSITEDVYLELLDTYGQYFEWCVHYDEMHALYRSNGNYNYARDYSTLRHRLLFVLQGQPEEGFTQAQYETAMRVSEHATPYIGIGGLRSLCRPGQFEVVERYLDAIYERLGPEICRWIHLFGVGNRRLLYRYRRLFGSADSSTWLCGVRGELLLPDGTRQHLQKPFNKLQVLQHNIKTMLEWIDLPYQQPLSNTPFSHLPIEDPYLLDTLPAATGGKKATCCGANRHERPLQNKD